WGFVVASKLVLWSPVGAPAGVPGPRRNADDCDAGWFAPVATRRRPIFGARWAPSLWLAVFPGGTTTRNPPIGGWSSAASVAALVGGGPSGRSVLLSTVCSGSVARWAVCTFRQRSVRGQMILRAAPSTPSGRPISRRSASPATLHDPIRANIRTLLGRLVPTVAQSALYSSFTIPWYLHKLLCRDHELNPLPQPLFGLTERDDGDHHHPQAHGGDDCQGQHDRHRPAEPGDVRREHVLRERAERHVAEHRVPHRSDHIGQWVDPG